MQIKQRIEQSVDKIKSIIQSNGGYAPRIFGSYLTLDFNEQSDLDILINLNSTRGLLSIVSMKHELEDLLGVKVDIVTENSIHPKIRDLIIAEARPL